MKPVIRIASILLLIGTLVSAQQVRCGGIIDCGDRELEFTGLAGNVPSFVAVAKTGAFPTFADTLETFDVEIEEENKGNLYKEIAAFAIITAMVSYMVVQLINPGEEEPEPEQNIKDIPKALLQVSLPLTP